MVLEKTLPLIVIFLILYFLKRKSILEKKDSKVFGKVLINLVIPVVIISSFSNINLEASLIYLPISALIIVSLLTIFGYLFAKILKLKDKTRGAFITTFPTLEGGTIGYAFMLAAFGELGLSRIILFDFANAIFLFTVVYFISGSFGKNNVRLKESVVKFLKAPLIWAIFIGLFLNIVGFQNVFLTNLFETISSSILLLVMLMLGLEFHPKISSFKLPALTILLKTSVGLSLGLLISMIFGLSGIERIAVIIGASLPPSIITLIFSEENNLDTEYVANLLSIALPFSLIFLMVLIDFI